MGPSENISTSFAKGGRGLLDLLSEKAPQPALAHGSVLQQEMVAPVERSQVQHSVFTRSLHLHPELSCQVIGVSAGVNCQHDMNEKGVSSSRQSNIMDKVDAIPPESYLTEYIPFCYVLPLEYRFSKDMLVSQWRAAGLIKSDEDQIAAGSIKSEEDQIVEEVCSRCFNKLLNSKFIVAAGQDNSFGPMYKVGDKMLLQGQLLEPKFRNHLGGEPTDVTRTEHLLLEGNIDLIDFDILKQCTRLQTLIIHRCCGSKLKCLLSDVLCELKTLKILSVSHTDVEVLACYLYNLKQLRYLDISGTPTRYLTTLRGRLSNLETLKLDGCRNIRMLPDNISELINLRHLFCDVATQLDLMPKGIGKLTKLQTLSAFLVNDVHRIGELRYLDRLRGSLGIWYLQDVKTKEEAAEAQLSNKKDLKKIEFLWRVDFDEKNQGQEEILESLQPPLGIKELQIWFYSGGVFPSWISSPTFNEIVTITLHLCRYYNRLPSLGDLPSLKSLKIRTNHEMVEIDSFFCRKQTNQHHVAFPKLEDLSLESLYKFEKWTGVVDGDFPCINSICIHNCPRLVGLPFLSHLRSLTYLDIYSCPEFSSLPEGGLPLGLQYLCISGCPKLRERCRNEQCEDWDKVSHVLDLEI